MYTNLLVKKPFIEDDKTQKRVVLSEAEIYDNIYSINSTKNVNLLQILLGKNNSDFNEKFFESDIIVILGN
jgi:hypothetical protein